MSSYRRAPLLLVCAGDPSGDQLAARAVRVWRAAHPDGAVEGLGGPALAASGLRPLEVPGFRWPFPSPTGLLEPLRAVPALLASAHAFLRRAAASEASAALLVDLPDVNLPLGRRVRARGLPVVQAVAPQTWAWRPGRVADLHDSCDVLAVILPFEEPYFRSFGIDARYVGHPLGEASGIRLQASGSDGVKARVAAEARSREPEASLALLPGGRPERVRHVLPALLAGACEVARRGALHSVVVSCAPAVDRRSVEDAVHGAALGIPVEVRDGSAVLEDPAAPTGPGDRPLRPPVSQVWVAAGTGSLEVAASGIPSCVAYRTGAFGFFVARRLVRGRWAGLANRLLEREVQPELLQDDLSPARLAGVFERLRRPEAFEAAAHAAVELRALLGGPGFSRRLAALLDEVSR